MKKFLIVASICVFISLTGCNTDDRVSSKEVYRETVIHLEAPAASVRAQAEFFNSSGALGSSAGVTNDSSIKSNDRIYRESAGAIGAEKGSHVNPTVAGEDRIYRETNGAGQILNESAGAELKNSPVKPGFPKLIDPQLQVDKSGTNVNGAKKPARAHRENILPPFPPLPER